MPGLFRYVIPDVYTLEEFRRRYKSSDVKERIQLLNSRFAQILRGFKNCGRVSVVEEVHHGRDPNHCQ
jgi:hypothetical protein